MKTDSELKLTNPHAAGIDVGSEHLHTSLRGDPPRVFGTTTGQVYALRDWLKKEGITTVAMEATGVYWLCAYEILEASGIEVVVVNGRYVRNVPGRKTDIKDSQWIATLHGYGLLKPGFVPTEQTRRLQDYMRLRSDHIAMAASHEQHLQKSLERMNLKIHDAISSLTGVSGRRMIEAILGGERNALILVGLCDPQIQKKKMGKLLEALEGNWRPQHLFSLRQAYELWQFYQEKIRECDVEIEAQLKAMAGPEEPQAPPPPAATKRAGGNAPQFESLHGLLYRLCGHKDVSQLPGMADYSALQLISELGTDLKKHWKNEKHFTSYLGLAPGSHQSGKRKGSQRRSRNRAGRIFCLLARSVGRSVDKALGGFYRRLKARRGGLIANIALARKLAQLYYRMMVHGLEYVEVGLQKYQEQVAQTEFRQLQKLARKHNFTLQPVAAL